jgi:glycosyltransferase involved in cell wall biosynthesis
MNQPKVCHLLLGAADEIAGIQKYLCSLLRQEDFAVINHAPKYEKYLTNNKQPFYIYKNFNEFLKIIAKECPQIIHVHLGQGIIPAWRASFSYSKLKLIYTQHFIAPAHTNNNLFFIKNFLLKFLFTRFAGMIAISQAVANGIKKRGEISPKKIFLIYNGVVLPAQPPKQKNKILPNIVTVCRLEKEKQPELILKLAKLIPEFKFTIVGGGAMFSKLKKIAFY